ncbi:MOSC N-terminal beta barrel domain-containing protein [Kiloniella antarctica]|uniref:MOSC N-terminal beta barrel domain-containing protein n=1 Tax=Kiloniella antarctica TaxID=1550907 RepID=A0ABW5BG81_9PROT
MSAAVVSDLLIYPIKSTAGLSMHQASILTSGLAGDRRYLITKPDGTFVTGRTHPKITAITCQYRGQHISLSHEDVTDLVLNPSDFNDQYLDTSVWGTDMIGQECGKIADNWISQLLGEPLKLLYFGDRSERFVKQHPENDVSFADGFPLLLIGDSSLIELNNRLLAPVSMANFRPNITISGTNPFEEDSWSQIRIGDVRFELPAPCARCVFTTVDPYAHVADKIIEPLKTLTKFRQETGGKNVMFGENMIPINTGSVRIGDPVEVLKTKGKPVYIDNWQPQSSRLSNHLSPKPSSNFDKSPILLRCVQVIDETSDVKTFKFTADPVQRFDYKPGQFLTLFVPINGTIISRCYTISSSPSRPDLLTITVKRVSGGTVSNWLHDHVTVGSSLEASGPSGIFHLQEKQNRKLLLISGGSGITPMLSMTRFMADIGLNYDVCFHHSAQTPADLIAWQELNLLARQLPGLTLSYNTSKSAPIPTIQEQGFEGRLSSDIIKKICPDLLEREVFVCGPDGYMNATKELLVGLGLSLDRYNQESFSIEPLPIPDDASSASYSIVFAKSGITAEIKGNQTVLDAAEAAGIEVSYSCRAGLCGTCKSDITNGKILAKNALGLSEEDTAKGRFLACCSYAKSNLKVEL